MNLASHQAVPVRLEVQDATVFGDEVVGAGRGVRLHTHDRQLAPRLEYVTRSCQGLHMVSCWQA